VKRLALAAGLLLLSGCGGGEVLVAGRTPVPAPPVRTVNMVTYLVDGSASKAAVTYETPTGTEQMTVDVPLVAYTGASGITFETFQPGAFLYISAQNQDAYGSVTCSIKVNGEVISENTADGAYAIATCKGTR
jgi:hypothetical protein